MQYIFENVGYFRCVGEVSALDGDVFKNSSFTCADRCTPNYRPSSYNSSFSQLVPALALGNFFEYAAVTFRPIREVT